MDASKDDFLSNFTMNEASKIIPCIESKQSFHQLTDFLSNFTMNEASKINPSIESKQNFHQLTELNDDANNIKDEKDV